MDKWTAPLLMGVMLAGPAVAQESKVFFVGDFESGRIQSTGSRHDGFYVGTLPDPQRGDEVLVSGKSDFNPSTNADTRVVASENVGGETVRPRKGQYFMRSQLYRTKNYLVLNGYAKNRPRSKISMSHDSFEIDFDQEGYAGFSIYVPRNFEHELGVRDHRGESALFIINADSSRTLVHLGVWVEAPATEAHWFLKTWTSSTTINEDGARAQLFDLGPVSADIGKWTDFVVRYRFNPFSVGTNPAAEGIPNAKNQFYQGNKGILQVWKAEGPADGNGDRKMSLKVDKTNEPIGLVPNTLQRIQHTWRIYKYGWIVNPTTLTHPVWFGFDEIRQGLVERDGTTFADVAPTGGACSNGCSEESERPKPPSSLAVE
jgi:hypothetical protein